MPRVLAKNRSYLDGMHQMYCDYNQGEREDCVFMAANQHPKAATYRKLSHFFQSLRYACNASARRFSFLSKTENSDFWQPELTVSWYPGETLRKFGHVYPAMGDRWTEYLQAAAAVRWKGAEPVLWGGTWHVLTESDDLVSDLRDVCKLHKAEFSASSAVRDKVECTAVQVQVNDRYALHLGILKVLRKHHKNCILPRRTPDDSAKDNEELPLAEKKFSLCNVSALTVGPRHIQVPLIPIGPSTELLLDTVNKISALLDQGYPFWAAEDWLKKFLKPAAFEELRAKHLLQPQPA